MGSLGGIGTRSSVRRGTRSRGGGGRDRFPVLVTVGSLVLALGLFFQSTVPALRERRELLEVERHKVAQQRALAREATSFALKRSSLDTDIQIILVELDRQGIYPADLLAELREAEFRGDGFRGDGEAGTADEPADEPTGETER